MDSTNGNDNVERSSSTRCSRSLRLSTGAASANDDDYDLNAMAVADGFRPSSNAHVPQSQPSNLDSSSQSSYLTGFTAPTSASDSDTPLGMRIRPSSISKPPPNHDSLTLRNEGSSNAPNLSSHARNMSTSDNLVIRSESPYQGPSGPSHPYQMYPQRTMSVATTSTAANAVIPEDRSYANPRGPTHPYALYTQNVSSGETNDASIPVGFNTAAVSYQRQLGPDGEEAGDLIGPLGHLEELPPYTRYPDNAYVPKTTTQTPTTEPSSPIQANENATSGPAIAGAGGIGMATRDPEFSSTDDDLALPRTRPSVRSAVSENSSHDINTAARDIAEKPSQNKWQRRAKRKLWGIIPYWAICLVTVGLVLMGIIMGAVIGTLLTRHKDTPPHPVPSADDKAQTSSTRDVTPLATAPTDLPALATGYYILPSLKLSQGPTYCLNDSTQSNAWSCDMPSTQFKIKVYLDEESCYNIYLTSNDYFKLRYGAQPPTFSQAQNLILVNDALEPSRGPGWWYRTTYNKTVLVSEDYFESIEKRGWVDDDDDDGYGYPSPGQYGKDLTHVKDGQKPWLCTFPNTGLDIFLYADQPVNTGYSATTSTYPPDATPTESSYPKSLPAYPQVFKMMERRYYQHGNQSATCKQVEIYGGGKQYGFLTDNDQSSVVLNENENPWPKDYERTWNNHHSKRWVPQLLPRTTEELTDCSCIWLAT